MSSSDPRSPQAGLPAQTAGKPITYLTAFKFALFFALVCGLLAAVVTKAWKNPGEWVIALWGFGGIFVIVLAWFSVMVHAERKRDERGEP